LALLREFGSAGVSEAYVVAPGEEVNFPGSVSNSLLAVSGSVQAVCNKMSTIDEMRAAFGRKHQQPSKLGACVRSRGNLCERDDSDEMCEIPSTMTFDFVLMRPK
jgi:hypothetical protein